MNKFKEMFSDYYKVSMVLLDLLLLGSMKFNPDIQWTHFDYFLLVSRILFPIIILLFSYKGMWVFYYLTAVVLTLDITFDDFTAITVFSILFLFIPKKHRWLKIATASSYFIAVFIVAYLHNKSPYHLFAHFIGCTALILTVNKLIPYLNKSLAEDLNKELILTNDEKLILTELKKGKLQKEIELFSPNTVTEKLKQARKRNGIKTKGTAGTEELLNRFLI